MDTGLDMSKYLGLFLQEAREQLAILEAELLELERSPTPERLQTIFRAAHTIKGSSRAMGFGHFADLTHALEDVLDALRSERLAIDVELSNVLLSTVDALGRTCEVLEEGGEDSRAHPELVAALHGFLSPRAGPVAPTSSVPKEALTALEFGSVGELRVRLCAECALAYARAYMCLTLVEEQAHLVATSPSAEELEAERFDREFSIFVPAGTDLEALATHLRRVSEVESVEVLMHERNARQVKTGPAEVPKASIPKAEVSTTVRVDVARLDALMNLVGELVIDRTRIAQITSSLSRRVSDPQIDALVETLGHVGRITNDLQDQIMKARMLPIDTVLNRFTRVVRDLANGLGKSVRYEIVGGETELDRSVIEVMSDPLLHLLRNCLDHGIETPERRRAAGKPEEGVLRVSARHAENSIVVEVEDDGAGIDLARVKAKAVANGVVTQETVARMGEKDALALVFASGVSTAETLSEVSGRGVGMDIVRANIQKLGGTIDLESKLGFGTKIALRLPLTLAIIRGLLIRSCGSTFVLPLTSVVETLLVSASEIQRVNQREVIVLRERTVPLLRLDEVFGGTLKESRPDDDNSFVVIVGLADRRAGLVVERLVGEQEVVIKSLGRFCGETPGISGATILGDGDVALIMDVNGVLAA